MTLHYGNTNYSNRIRYEMFPFLFTDNPFLRQIFSLVLIWFGLQSLQLTKMEQLYHIGIPSTVQRITALFYELGLWTPIGEKPSFGQRAKQLFYFVYFLVFVLSMAAGGIGAYASGNNDESICLIVLSMLSTLQLYRMFVIIRRQVEIRSLIDRVGIHGTNDRLIFIKMDVMLKRFMALPKYFISFAFFGLIFSIVSPIASNEHMPAFNIGYRLKWEHRSAIEFWLAYVLITGSICLSVVICLLTIIVWYLMISVIIEYKMLGNQFSNMGNSRETSYYGDLVVAIKTSKEINEKTNNLSSVFSTLFLLQIVMSSACICGSTFTLAYSSHDDLIQDGMNFVAICIWLFDTAMITYLGNEIKDSSDRLSYCIFASNWHEQTESCKKVILVVTEMLQKPQELVVGFFFPLNLTTFTAIVKRAYSMFNVLLSLRK